LKVWGEGPNKKELNVITKQGSTVQRKGETRAESKDGTRGDFWEDWGNGKQFNPFANNEGGSEQKKSGTGVKAEIRGCWGDPRPERSSKMKGGDVQNHRWCKTWTEVKVKKRWSRAAKVVEKRTFGKKSVELGLKIG